MWQIKRKTVTGDKSAYRHCSHIEDVLDPLAWLPFPLIPVPAMNSPTFRLLVIAVEIVDICSKSLDISFNHEEVFGVRGKTLSGWQFLTANLYWPILFDNQFFWSSDENE